MRHSHYYLLLAGIFILGFVLTATFGVSKQLQLLFIIITAFFYVVLGIVHHIKEHSLSVKIMIEYIVIAMLGISISFYIVSATL